MAKQPENTDKTIRRKTGVVRLTFKSESVFLQMRGASGKNLNSAMYRVGELLKMTARSHDKSVYNDLCKWFENEIITAAKNEIDNLEKQLTVLQEDVDTGLEFLNVKTPIMTIDVDVIHKSHGEIFSLLNKVDFLMDDIETLLLTGVDDDQNIESSSRAIVNLIINDIARKIFTVTKPGKRNGGAFSAVFYIQQLQQGVFSLYPEQEADNILVDEGTKVNEVTPDAETVSKSETVSTNVPSNDEVNLSEAV